jgi:hypothetical protein
MLIFYLFLKIFLSSINLALLSLIFYVFFWLWLLFIWEFNSMEGMFHALRGWSWSILRTSFSTLGTFSGTVLHRFNSYLFINWVSFIFKVALFVQGVIENRITSNRRLSSCCYSLSAETSFNFQIFWCFFDNINCINC